MALAERGDVLPRRQDLPEEAFLSSAQLRRIEQGARHGFDLAGFAEALQRFGKEPSPSSFLGFIASFFGRKRNPDRLLPVISVSYCWLEAAHPDREGRQLQLLSRKLRGLYGGRGLLGACREYGFSDMVSCLPPLMPTITPFLTATPLLARAGRVSGLELGLPEGPGAICRAVRV